MGEITSKLSAMVLAYNEEVNIHRCLSELQWLDRVIVIDSGSTDQTISLCEKFDNVEVYERPFTTHAEQCNFGLEKINSDWVLSLDADYILTGELVKEIMSLREDADVGGYTAPFRYCIDGKELRSTLLPPRCVLYRKACSSYIDDGHTQRIKVEASVKKLSNPILHDDRKPLSRWLESQLRYSALEAKKLAETSNEQLSISDRIRSRIFFAPIIMLFYTLFWKGLLLDGWAGIYYSSQRIYAELLLSLRLFEHRFLSKNSEKN
jgi:glycosyltransferase involved in cell wall biosynthesis